MIASGEKAFKFSGIDQDGNTIALNDFKGKRLVLYFYPQDLTETCTLQACNIRDNFPRLKKNKIAIIGISPDTKTTHKKFEKKYQLPFPLIADTDHTIINAFGVWGEKKLFGRDYLGLIRTTFLIDEKGIVRKVITKPKSRQHVEEILESWKKI